MSPRARVFSLKHKKQPPLLPKNTLFQEKFEVIGYIIRLFVQQRTDLQSEDLWPQPVLSGIGTTSIGLLSFYVPVFMRVFYIRFTGKAGEGARAIP